MLLPLAELELRLLGVTETVTIAEDALLLLVLLSTAGTARRERERIANCVMRINNGSAAEEEEKGKGSRGCKPTILGPLLGI